MTIPQNPSDRTYTETHEWLKVDGDVLTIGLTTYAVDQLTDVTFAEMQPVGTEVAPGDSVGEVESVKTSSDVYSPVQGEIIEVNESLDSNPEQVNSDPFGDGWLVKIKITDQGTLGDAMDSEAYTASIS
ncbi:MAG: glycine cleavage system protein GcvH [Phycisphaerales bacterium]|nr:glycine cleavage system protein GcvH [Phycisphaerales bacterium]